MTDEQITNYIFIEDADVKGDIAFVFGTWMAWHESVEKAAELYHKGLVPKILFTGGVNKKSGVVEGEAMAQQAINLGVPKEDILIENKSTNTLENVIFSLKIIEQEIGLENIKTITAVVKNFHARRALMTLRKHIPEHISLKACAYMSNAYPFTKDTWQQSDFGRECVYKEIEKIKIYLAKGDLAEL